MVVEQDRLAVIDALKIAQREDAASFTNLARVAADCLGAPIAAISVLARDTQWFFAAHGLDAERGPRCDAFCEEVVRTGETLVVSDAAADPRFRQNGYVLGAPKIRFYAGAPIEMEPGLRVGALLVIDREPRTVSDAEIETLHRLARMAVDLFKARARALELQTVAEELSASRQRMQVECARLEEAAEVSEIASELANLGAWSVDLRTETVSWSNGVRRIHGVPANYEPTLDAAIAFYTPDARARLQSEIQTAVETGGGFELELPIRTGLGERKWLRSVGRVRREGGVPVKLFGCAIDVTEERRAKAEIETLATQDTLTDLLNRRSLEVRYERHRASAAASGPVGLILIDLDNFKEINDGEGHDVGDQLLKAVADVLRAETRSTDCVGRLGGDEFLVMVFDGARDGRADTLAERLVRCLASSPALRDQAFPVTASIGVAAIDDPTLDFFGAMKQADLALYQAKREGRDRAVRYTPAIGGAFDARQQVLREVDHALRAGQITPVYQPKRYARGGGVAGCEALARWDHPERGLLTPGAFLAAFEDPCYAARISEAVLARAIADIARMRAMGIESGRIAVNLAQRQLTDPTFPERFDDLLMTHGVGADALTFELTETILLSRYGDSIRERLIALRRRGVAIAFDDFGTGYASLTHLTTFPIDQLKIDASFVRNLTDDRSSRAIAAALVRMAQEMGMETVAEGVEDAPVVAALTAMGCDQIQGFFHARPQPFDALIAFLRAETAAGRGYRPTAPALEAAAS